MFKRDFSCPALLEDVIIFYLYGAITHYGLSFHTILIFIVTPLGCFLFARHYWGNLC